MAAGRTHLSHTCALVLFSTSDPLSTPPPPNKNRVVYRLLLTYKLSATEAGKYKPTVPLLNE